MCQGVPRVTNPSVMPFLAAFSSYARDQSAHAVAPCHSCGGNSSMMDAGDAHAASPVAASPLLKLSTNWRTVARTADGSDAPASAGIPQSIVAATTIATAKRASCIRPPRIVAVLTVRSTFMADRSRPYPLGRLCDHASQRTEPKGENRLRNPEQREVPTEEK